MAVEQMDTGFPTIIQPADPLQQAMPMQTRILKKQIDNYIKRVVQQPDSTMYLPPTMVLSFSRQSNRYHSTPNNKKIYHSQSTKQSLGSSC
jgi:hypothetical protein